MPRGDGTGPMGAGAMTGRQAGYCAGNMVPGKETAGFGGFGRGRHGSCRVYGAAPRGGFFRRGARFAMEEKDILQRQAEALALQLRQVKNRLQELDEENKLGG